MPHILYYLLCIGLTQLSPIDANSDSLYKLTIVHINDLYSAFTGVKPDNSLCDLNDDLKQCSGGAPKILAQVNKFRSKGSTFFLNAGNNLGGFWYNQFGPEIMTEFFGSFGFDATAIGLSDYELQKSDKEFDYKVFDQLSAYFKNVSHKTKVMSCNFATKYIDGFFNYVKKSFPIQSTGFRIGVIGFAKPPNYLNDFKAFDYLNISDPIKCLQEQSEQLKRNGHKFIIAIGSGDQQFFRDIANTVTNVDLVIGSYGFTQNLSLLNERAFNESYPDFVVKGNPGQRIVVTADVFGKSVGKLSLMLDSNTGNIRSSEGTLIKLDEQIEDMDEKTHKLLDKYQRSLFIGTTAVYLDGNDCSTRECNLGNLISDSMIHYYNHYIKHLYNKSLIEPKGNDLSKEQPIDENRDVIALVNSEAIVNSIGNVNSREYLITKISLDGLFNRGSLQIQLFVLNGKTIRLLLEEYRQRSDLLQVSGIRVSYDLSKPINQTIIEISVKCTNCSVQQQDYRQLDDTELYYVLMPKNIYFGETNENLPVINDLSALNMVQDYIKLNSPINTTVENRITFINDVQSSNVRVESEPESRKNDAFGTETKILMTLFSTLIAVCHLRYYN